MKAYSLDLRDKILRAGPQQVGSQRAIARLFGVSPSFVEKLLRRHRTTGDLAPRPHAGGRRASCDAAARVLVRQAVQAQPDATLAELCERLYTHRGIRVSVPPMSRLAKQLGLPRKKSLTMRASRTPGACSQRVRPTKR